ncbi:hypothetical protein DV20_27540 [Amycolatopsis rifamycinica]|uniref:Uncharacterized protein n=2 Tax=Amycolatopsis rifamycinica TaxID=287986 RepID=A0A066TUU4_9PSEU|nr:hypothetical protein DV20_27540 [Amycolatopsis rifamycinica]
MTFLRMDIPDGPLAGRPVRSRMDGVHPVHGRVLALQRAAGNAATTSALGTVQRSVVDEIARMKPDQLVVALQELNPKAAATNLWVTVDGKPVTELISRPAGFESLWPIQSGRGPHAEERFAQGVMPLLAARQPRYILLEITKSPCPSCTALLSQLVGEHPGTRFELHMLGLYPGAGEAEGERGAATRPEDLAELERKLQAKLLDLRAVIDRLTDEQWRKRFKYPKHTKIPIGTRIAALKFARSVHTTMVEARLKLGERQDQTAYGAKLKDLEDKFAELAAFLTAKKADATASARHEPYPAHETGRPTPAAETVTDLDRWTAIKAECPDLQLSEQTYGEYFLYSSHRAFTWFYVHNSLPE